MVHDSSQLPWQLSSNPADSLPDTRCHYIGGAWHLHQGAFTPNTNPARLSDQLGESPVGTEADVLAAIRSAKLAQRAWHRLGAPARGQILLRAARLFEAHQDALSALLTREEGKTLLESAQELSRSIGSLNYAAAQGVRLMGAQVPSQHVSQLIYTSREPLWVVGLITPWNFPVSIPVWKIAPALIAGNSVILKPSPYTPLTARAIVDLFVAAGVPAGVLNLVYGDREAGEVLASHPDVAAVSFTGSTRVGKAVYQQVAAHMGRCLMEMGGKNPAVVMPDANLSEAADAIITGAFGSTGQRCTATSRAIIHHEVYPAMLAILQERAAAIRVGDGANPNTTMGPLVDDVRLTDVHAHIEKACQAGARRIPIDVAIPTGGHYITPVLFADVTPEMALFRDEVFGPVLALTPADSFEHAVTLANDCDYGLSSSIFTNDLNLALQFTQDSTVGLAHVNLPTTYSEPHLPFGGVKDSGFGGRESGLEAIEFFTEWKSTYVSIAPSRNG